MSRKTNLFYINTDDSNFLTFSNFTEALTGNFLSTDWKVYPSRFLCLYIPSLDPDNDKYDESNKDKFIKENLVAYYENKLAFLRDYYTEALSENREVATVENADMNSVIKDLETFDIEGDINALAWLMKTIKEFDPDFEITFLGDVTEFDYKGTYTDTICIIDSSEGFDENGNVVKYSFELTQDNTPILYSWENGPLYGWSNDEIKSKESSATNDSYDDSDDDISETEEKSEYDGIEPKFDSGNEYDIYSTWQLNSDVADVNSIKFNIVIPLFDITNMYYTNFNAVDENFTLEENLELKNYIYDEETGELKKQDIDYSDREKRSINNPLGIWFADETIELKRDLESKYAPSWSLVISSQFKPFPYSNKYLANDLKKNKENTKDTNQAFYTYAKILSRQNDVSDKLTKISSRLSVIEQSLAKLDTLDNKELIEKVSSLEVLTENLNDILNNLDNIIDTKIAAAIDKLYRWKERN